MQKPTYPPVLGGKRGRSNEAQQASQQRKRTAPSPATQANLRGGHPCTATHQGRQAPGMRQARGGHSGSPDKPNCIGWQPLVRGDMTKLVLSTFVFTAQAKFVYQNFWINLQQTDAPLIRNGKIDFGPAIRDQSLMLRQLAWIHGWVVSHPPPARSGGT